MNTRDLMVQKGGKIALILDEPTNLIKAEGTHALMVDLTAKMALALDGKLHQTVTYGGKTLVPADLQNGDAQ